MFKKLLAAAGVGGATVDTRLANPRLAPGEVLSGEVVVQGGSVAQRIEAIELLLMAEVEVESGDHEHREARALGRLRVSDGLQIEAGETRALPFALTLPRETPVNLLNHHGRPLAVWIHTDLAIAQARDNDDRDWLEVAPTPQMQALFAAFEALGWGLYSTDVEAGTARAGQVTTTLGCYQEFELRPYRSQWQLQEIELTFIPDGDAYQVLVEVDARFGRDGYTVLTMGRDYATVDWARRLCECIPALG